MKATLVKFHMGNPARIIEAIVGIFRAPDLKVCNTRFKWVDRLGTGKKVKAAVHRKPNGKLSIDPLEVPPTDV